MTCLITFMVAVILTGMFCIAYGCYQLWFTNMLRRKGIALRGTIIDRITRNRRGFSTISYRYEFEGKDYVQDQRIAIRHSDDYDRGSTVTVYCLPHLPARARIRDTSWYSRMILMNVGLIFMLLCILLIFLTDIQNGQMK